MALSEDKIKGYIKRLLLSRMRILCNHGFYGLLLMHMIYAVSEKVETACTDGVRITFGTEFLDSLTDAERLYHYMDEETFYPQKSLSKLTDGCSNTNSFRLWLRRYIKDTPQEIPNDEMQYRFLCHLKALEFWDGFEDIRNLHYVRKPFIVKNYGEHLEHKNEISTLFDRAMDTGRQVIVLLPVNKEREKAGRKYERRQASRTSQA